MQPLDILILSLATLYTAHVLVLENGPFSVFQRLRDVTTIGGLLECTICCSFWVALLFYIVMYRSVNIIDVLAITGIAVVVNRIGT